MEQELSQGVSAVKALTAAVFASGASFQQLVSNIAAVGFAARLNILGIAVQAIGSLVGTFSGLFKAINDTETRLVRISTALRGMGRDANTAGAVFDAAMQKAASTPFDLDQVLHSVTQLAGYGIAALDELKKKNGEIIRDFRGEAVTLVDVLGNVAGATGRTLSSTMEAYADAIMGEWERMKEFGIKKSMIPGLAALKAGTPEYQRVLTEWLATTDRFAGGMFKQSRTISGMMTNLGDVFTRFGIAVGGAADDTLKNNDEAALRAASGNVMKDIKSGKTSVIDVAAKYNVNLDSSAFKGLKEGTEAYTRRLELAIRYSKELGASVTSIGQAGTLYDAIRLSVRELYNSFDDASEGIAVWGIVIGQWFKQIWATFIYPAFVAVADFFKWIGAAGLNFRNSMEINFMGIEKEADKIARQNKKISENIGLAWAMFLAFFWTPLIEAIGAVIGWLGKMFEVFNAGFAKSAGGMGVFERIWHGITELFKEAWNAIGRVRDAFVELFSAINDTGVFSGFFAYMGKFSAILWDGFVGSIGAAIEFISSAFVSIMNTIRPGLVYLGEAFTGLFSAIGDLLDEIFGGDGVSTFFDVLKSVASFLGNVIGWLIGTFFKGVAYIIGFIVKGITMLITGVKDFIAGIKYVSTAIYDGIGRALEWIGKKWNDWVVSPIRSLVTFIGSAFDAISDGIRRAANLLKEYMPGATSVSKEVATAVLTMTESDRASGRPTVETTAKLADLVGSKFTGSAKSALVSGIKKAKTSGELDEYVRGFRELAETGSTVINVKIGSKTERIRITSSGDVVKE